jgi:hypothetical protein
MHETSSHGTVVTDSIAYSTMYEVSRISEITIAPITN